MGVVTRGKKKRLEKKEEEEEELVDRISRLPDDVLGDIVSLLPTKDGARTQVLSSRWRHLWRSAPLNLEFQEPWWGYILAEDISRVLAAHPGPGRRLQVSYGCHYLSGTTATLDDWLRSPAMDGLKEIDIFSDSHGFHLGDKPLPLPASVLRFSSTLCTANFKACVFPDIGNNNNANNIALHWPFLKKLTLSSVTVSESYLHTLLAGCSAIESLLLQDNNGFSRVKIVSPSLRSIGVSAMVLQQLVIEDAPCLERLLLFKGLGVDLSVVSAPRLHVLGKLRYDDHMLHFDTIGLQGSTVATLTAVVPSVRVLALSSKPCLGTIINWMKCFPYLDTLHIELRYVAEKNALYDKCQKPIGNLDIRLRKIVLAYFQDRKSHINFAKFFVRNASELESMTFQLKVGKVGHDLWITNQHRLLGVKQRASRNARFDFVSCTESFSLSPSKQVHDLSILDPFQRIRL